MDGRVGLWTAGWVKWGSEDGLWMARWVRWGLMDEVGGARTVCAGEAGGRVGEAHWPRTNVSKSYKFSHVRRTSPLSHASRTRWMNQTWAFGAGPISTNHGPLMQEIPSLAHVAPEIRCKHQPPQRT